MMLDPLAIYLIDEPKDTNIFNQAQRLARNEIMTMPAIKGGQSSLGGCT
jgi:hypothetical protein